MREMINKSIGVSLIALTLVVSLFFASAITNVYADNDKELSFFLTNQLGHTIIFWLVDRPQSNFSNSVLFINSSFYSYFL
jgi:hypothetical protein